MRKLSSEVLCCIIVITTTFAATNAAESPDYWVVMSDTDLEIRGYRETFWMSAVEHGSVFQKSTKDGFHRLYQYIHGANFNSTRLNMTAPVLTTVSLSPHSNANDYAVRYYLPAKFNRRSPPQPVPDLQLEMEKWSSRCVAVRNFSGFATQDSVYDQRDALLSSLAHRSMLKVFGDKDSFSVAQYTAPRQLSGRRNEVWIDVQPSACSAVLTDHPD